MLGWRGPNSYVLYHHLRNLLCSRTQDAFFSIPLDPPVRKYAWFYLNWPRHPDFYLTHPGYPTLQVPVQFTSIWPSFGLWFFSLCVFLNQYGDDRLLCSLPLKISQADTSTLLKFLSGREHRVSPSKVQLSTTQGITLDRKHLIQSLTFPQARMQFYPSYGWLTSFSLLACPPDEAALGPFLEPLLWPIAKPFHKLQWDLPVWTTNQQVKLIPLTHAFQPARGNPNQASNLIKLLIWLSKIYMNHLFLLTSAAHHIWFQILESTSSTTSLHLLLPSISPCTLSKCPLSGCWSLLIPSGSPPHGHLTGMPSRAPPCGQLSSY